MNPLVSLVLPIGGEIDKDWYLTYHVDQADSGVGDYACGPKAYEGHRGTDMALPNFAKMDEGVPVIAAAAGTVLSTHDGEYDRNKEWLDGVRDNAIAIDHGHGFVALYGHLKKNSLRVAGGERVDAGDTIAWVGSSGVSDIPHVHFEVLFRGAVHDPFSGPCGEKVSIWARPIPYQDEFHWIDAGIADGPLDLNRVKDPPPPVNVVAPGQTLSAWVQYHNAPAGTQTRWTIRGPDGQVHVDRSVRIPEAYPFSWWWIPRRRISSTIRECGQWSFAMTVCWSPPEHSRSSRGRGSRKGLKPPGQRTGSSEAEYALAGAGSATARCSRTNGSAPSSD